MTELMQREVQALFYFFFGGMSIMFLFRLRDQLCRFCGGYPRLRRSLYLFFWIFAAFLFYQFAYHGAYGVISWYSLLAFGFGIMSWKIGLCDIITLYNTVQKQIEDTKYEKKNKRTYSKVRRKNQTK